MLRDLSTPQINNRKCIERESSSTPPPPPPPPPPPDAGEEFFSDVVLGESFVDEEESSNNHKEINLHNNPVIVMEMETISSDSLPHKPDKLNKWISIVPLLTCVVIILILSILIIMEKAEEDVSYRVDMYYGGRSCLFNHIHPTVPVNYGVFSYVESLKIGQIQEDSHSNFKVKLVSVTHQRALAQVAFDMDDMKEFCHSLWTVSAVVDSNEYGNFSLNQTCEGDCGRIDHHVSVKVSENR